MGAPYAPGQLRLSRIEEFMPGVDRCPETSETVSSRVAGCAPPAGARAQSGAEGDGGALRRCGAPVDQGPVGSIRGAGRGAFPCPDSATHHRDSLAGGHLQIEFIGRRRARLGSGDSSGRWPDGHGRSTAVLGKPSKRSRRWRFTLPSRHRGRRQRRRRDSWLCPAPEHARTAPGASPSGEPRSALSGFVSRAPKPEP